jgi:ribonuclease D
MIFLDGDLPPDLARTLRGLGRVAIDTETSGLDWVTDRLHLCQLFTPETGPVLLRHVDHLPAELAGVMGDPAILKVLHFAPFDLRFLEAQWGVHTRSVACTKAASRLLDPGLPAADHSLQALLQRHLRVAVAKGSVRTSDWGASALTEDQIAYATADVAHLLDLHEVLSKRLQSEGQSKLFAQVCAYMPVDAHLSVLGVPNPLTY